MAKAEMMEMAIFPNATPSAMIRLLVSVMRTGVLPTRPYPSVSTFV